MTVCLIADNTVKVLVWKTSVKLYHPHVFAPTPLISSVPKRVNWFSSSPQCCWPCPLTQDQEPSLILSPFLNNEIVDMVWIKTFSFLSSLMKNTKQNGIPRQNKLLNENDTNLIQKMLHFLILVN